MKTIQSFLLLLVVTMSLNVYSASKAETLEAKNDPFSEEIAKMLLRSNLIIEKDFTVKVFFTVDEDKVITIESISSTSAVVSDYLRARLEGQQLKGNRWLTDKVYELPVRIKAVR